MPDHAYVPAHAPRIPAQMAPGSEYVRLLTDDAQVLAEHALPATDEGKAAIAKADQRLAFRHLRAAPSAVVFSLVYNGDTGDCMDVNILAASDVRAHDLRRHVERQEPAE